MGSFLTDCASSVEQIRQRAAGSLVEQHAHFCHRGEEEGSHPSLLFVKALSHRDQLMTALLNLWTVFLWSKEQDLWLTCFLLFFFLTCMIRKITKCKMGPNTGGWVLKFEWALLSCSAELYLSALAGARRGKGNRRFMSSCDTRCSGSHVNGKWDV